MNFELSHAVDDSDVAFAMRLDRRSTVCSMLGSTSAKFHKVGTNIDGFINLATLNYLLAGLQLCYVSSHTEKSKWFELLHDLDQYTYQNIGTQLTLWDLRYITRELIVPFGLVRGSEKQGGQDETGLSAATWPVNFVCNMVLDGHDRNILNYWHYHDISAGDDLVFRLKPMPIPKGKNAYTLNHYYKRFVQHNFESYFQQALGRPYATHVWQMVPEVLSLDYKPENDETNGQLGVRMTPGFEVPHDYVWQEQGFWHIARSQVMVRKYAVKEYYNDDMANQLKVSHLDVTFEPTYTKMPGECKDAGNPRMVKKDARPPNLVNPVQGADFKHDLPRAWVAPGMMSEGRASQWAPQLRLEELLGGSMPLLPGQGSGSAQASRPTFASELMAVVEAEDSAKRARTTAPSLAGSMGPPPPRQPSSILHHAPSDRPRQSASSGVRFDLPAPEKKEGGEPPKAESLDYSLTFSEQDPAPSESQQQQQAKQTSEAEPEQEVGSGPKSLSSILASMGGGRGRKRKTAPEEAGGEATGV